jgi:hypothetical protein
MRTIAIAMVGLLLSMHVPAADAIPPTISCDEAKLETIGDLNAALSDKAVGIIRLSATDDGEVQLKRLVSPTATFSVGGGDVGRPLGTYLTGARAMARDLSADTYRFRIWSSIPTPVEDACGTHTVEVEFIDTPRNYSYPVKFAFSRGILISAEGWRTLFKTGPAGLSNGH